MKLITDERIKHRVTGLIVLLSLAVIFVPALIKKSTRRLSDNLNIAIQLPPRPVAPQVIVPSEKVLFETVKVAHRSTPLPRPVQLHSHVAQIPVRLTMPTAVVPPPSVVAQVIVRQPKVVPPVKTVKMVTAKKLPQALYAVQLASFSQQHNANVLIKRLRASGYQATYTVVSTPHGAVYKVLVGAAKRRDDARNLQKKLATDLQLQGFIIQARLG